MPKIKTITNTRKFLTDRLKLLCGHRVTIGKTYTGLTAINGGFSTDEEMKALYFENNTLLLSSKNQKYFVFTSGDLANWGNRIITDRVISCIRFNEAITQETDFSEIRRKYYRVPPTLIDYVIKGIA